MRVLVGPGCGSGLERDARGSLLQIPPRQPAARIPRGWDVAGAVAGREARNGGNVAYKRDSTVADDAPSCVGSHTMVGTIFGVGLSIGLFGSTGAARCNASTYMEHLNSYIHQCPQRITVTIKSSERGAHSEQH
jgi:hypothetical protein